MVESLETKLEKLYDRVNKEGTSYCGLGPIYGDGCHDVESCSECYQRHIQRLLQELREDYVAKPRYADTNEVVHPYDITIKGIVGSIVMFEDGSWYIEDVHGSEIYTSDEGDNLIYHPTNVIFGDMLIKLQELANDNYDCFNCEEADVLYDNIIHFLKVNKAL